MGIAKRNISRQVKGTTVVTSSAQVDVLASLLGVRPAQLKLTTLFSTGTSGWDVKAFHDTCDGQGATFTIVMSGESFYGGYTSVSWHSRGSFQPDGQAFLFRFKCPSRQNAVTSQEKFGHSNAAPADGVVYGRADYGPVFGYKHDFFTFGTGQQPFSAVSYGGHFSAVSYGRQASFTIPNTLYYDSSMPSKANSIVEVLKVETSASVSEELEESWNTAFPWAAEAVTHLRDSVFKYDPQQTGLPVPNINILLCGGVGAGKSSIVSTVDSICKGRISRRAPHGQGTGSLTRMLRKYKFTQPINKDPVKWQLWDSMGWVANDYKRGELAFILDGNLQDKSDLSKSITTLSQGFVASPKLADRVHCMLCVVPCSAATDETYMTRLHEMQQFARERELPILVCLTKIDAYDPDVIGHDLAKTFHSSRLLQLVEELEETSGVGGRKDILPVKNLSSELGPTTELTALMCSTLQQCLYAAEDYITECGSTSTLRSELSD